jgi:hypothetical protein
LLWGCATSRIEQPEALAGISTRVIAGPIWKFLTSIKKRNSIFSSELNLRIFSEWVLGTRLVSPYRTDKAKASSLQKEKIIPTASGRSKGTAIVLCNGKKRYS